MQTVKQKSTALFLCVCLLASLFAPLATVVHANAAERIAILCGNTEVSEISVTQEQSAELSARAPSASADYQWQILADVAGEEMWVNIAEETESTCTVTYPLVATMLKNNRAKLRCAVTDGGKISYSDAVTVTASETVSAPKEKNDTGFRQSPAAADPVPIEPGDAELENVWTITVQYLYKDGTKAHDPYVARIEKNSAFSTTVVSPDIVGYTPLLDNAEDAKQVKLEYPSVTKNEVVTVTYHPVKVTYQVEHCIQKLINDSYIVSKTEQKKGLVGELTDAKAEDLPGFRSQPVKNIRIAADGSTVVRLYHDRLYYLMAFKLDGGYGTEPIYARYESPVSISKPAKAGCVFQGWKKIQQDETGAFLKDESGNFVTEGTDGEFAELPRTIPAKNTGYLAVWEKVETTYTVIYMVQNPDDDEYSYYGYQHKAAKTGDRIDGENDLASVEGIDTKEIQYFRYNDEKTEKNIEVKGDSSTIVKVYYDRKVYTLNFYFARQNRATNKKYIANRTSWNLDSNNVVVGDGGKYNDPGCMRQEIGANDTVWASFVDGAKIEENSDGYNYYYVTLTAKYGATLEKQWPTLGQWPLKGSCDISGWQFISWGVEKNSGYWNSNANKNIKGVYLHMDDQLIIEPDTPKAQDLMAYYNNNEVKTYDYEIYFQDLEKNYPTEPNHKYKIRSTAVANQQTVIPFTGMTYQSTKYASGDGSNQKGGTIKYYYTRNTYKLEFHSHSTSIPSKDFQYEAPLNGNSITPAYPDDLPPNLYEFNGWYTTSEHLQGTEFDFETETMPANNVILYALWSPKEFNVSFFQTATLGTQIGESMAVPYGQKIEKPETPSLVVPGVELSFVGWFYMSDGVEKAVDFEEFLVQGDVDIYAKWTSERDVSFTVKYQLEDDTPVAPMLEGFAKGGENRTFQAKTGNLLYKDYQTGYYPTVSSHTILMDSELGLEYIFVYEKLPTTTYTVRYLDRETHQPLHLDKKVTDNELAVVVEQYEQIANYVPDAFAKRLTVTTNPDQNVITFWYRKAVDPKIAPYTITHYLQDPDNPDKYFLYQYRNVQLVAGEKYLVSVLELEGYTFKEFKVHDLNGDVSQDGIAQEGGVMITLPQGGAKIDLYYDCYPTEYIVKHLDYDTGNPIIDEKTHSGLVGATVTENALTQDELQELGISHYGVYGSAKQTRVLAEVADSARVINEFIFYYTEKEIDYHYVPVVRPSGYTDFGTVSLSTETVRVSSGEAKGSAPIQSAGFEFKGWYLDEACKQPVQESVYKNYLQPDGKTLKPQKNAAGVYDDALAVDGQIIFYALFEPPTVADLVITKSGADDKNQVFVYRVTGSYGMDMEVTIVGNDSVTIHALPRGSYIVTEDNGWSWRYENGQETEKKVPNHGATGTPSAVEFTTTTTGQYWLDGHSKLVKNKKKKTGGTP